MGGLTPEQDERLKHVEELCDKILRPKLDSVYVEVYDEDHPDTLGGRMGSIDAPAVIESATDAVVRYDPQPGDFADAGLYAVQWRVMHSGDLPQFIPDDGYDELDCLAPLVAVGP